MTMPSTSPIAQPVRQWTVALNATALSERLSGGCPPEGFAPAGVL